MRATERALPEIAKSGTTEDVGAGTPDIEDHRGDLGRTKLGRADIEDRRVAAAVKRIDSASKQPRLLDLAREAGLSPSHFQRCFKRIVGLSPTQYGIAVRRARLRGALAQCQSVTAAIFEAGFGSASQAYATFRTEAGLTLSVIRAGGRGAEVTYVGAVVGSRRLHLAFTKRGLCHLSLTPPQVETRAELKRLLPSARLIPMREIGMRARISAAVEPLCAELSEASGARERALVETLRRRLAAMRSQPVQNTTQTPLRLREQDAVSERPARITR